MTSPVSHYSKCVTHGIANALKVSADVLLSDVLDYGYKVKASQPGEIIEQLSPEKRERVFDVISAMSQNQRTRERTAGKSKIS